MLTQTSETAIRALIYLVLAKADRLLTPKDIAEHLGTSPSYMAKITHQLVKANILHSQRGAAGGVTMAREPESVSLLEIVEACQGLLVGNYCQEIRDHPEPVCAFHEAMKETHVALVRTLSKWTLADLVARPGPSDPAQGVRCKMGFVGCEGEVIRCGPRGVVLQPRTPTGGNGNGGPKD